MGKEIKTYRVFYQNPTAGMSAKHFELIGNVDFRDDLGGTVTELVHKSDYDVLNDKINQLNEAVSDLMTAIDCVGAGALDAEFGMGFEDAYYRGKRALIGTK